MKRLLLVVLLLFGCQNGIIDVEPTPSKMTNMDLLTSTCGEKALVEDSFLVSKAEEREIELVKYYDLLLDATAIAVLFEKDTGVQCEDVHKVLDHVEKGLGYTEINYEMILTTLIEDTAKAKLIGGVVQRHFNIFVSVEIIRDCDRKILQRAVDYYREVFQCQ